MSKFMLVGALKGKTVILGMNQYSFVDGVLECSKDDADKIEHTLKTNYGAKRMAEDDAPSAEDAKKAAEEAAAAEAEAKRVAEEAAAEKKAATTAGQK